MQLTEIRVAGFGGPRCHLSRPSCSQARPQFIQGAYATMKQNFWSEARGGACSAQLVLSDSPVLYPYVTKPDIMVVMSQEAYVVSPPSLKDGAL